MRAWLVLILFSVLAICFILDPTPTIVEDTTDKTTERYPYLYNTVQADNNTNSDKNDQRENLDIGHFALRVDHIV